MAFHTGNYDAFCLLGDPAAVPLWKWTQWKAILPFIAPIVASARDRAAVRSNQYLPDQQGTVKFGRIGWNTNGHQKWTHDSPTNAPESSDWKFLNVEVWAPSWTICERDNRAPDVYLSIANEGLGAGFNKELSFNPVVVFAVTSELAGSTSSDIDSAVKALANTTNARLCGHKVRPWGKSAGGGFTNSIQDLCISGLFKPGPRHLGSVDFDLLAEEWTPCPS